VQTYAYTFRHKNGWGSCSADDFPSPTHCHECVKPLPVKDPNSCTSGYGCSTGVIVGETRDGVKIEQSRAICYACCHAHDLEQLRDTSKPFTAYVSSDGRQITNWPGAALMRIYSHHTGRAGFGGNLHYYRAVDLHGQHWHGKNSGEGMCINLRACR